MKRKIESVAIDQTTARLAFAITEAAQSLGCHPDTLRRAANQGRLRVIRLSRRVLIPASEMQRILAEGL
jgi:excisionase family DNA binding protein